MWRFIASYENYSWICIMEIFSIKKIDTVSAIKRWMMGAENCKICRIKFRLVIRMFICERRTIDTWSRCARSWAYNFISKICKSEKSGNKWTVPNQAIFQIRCRLNFFYFLLWQTIFSHAFSTVHWVKVVKCMIYVTLSKPNIP